MEGSRVRVGGQSVRHRGVLAPCASPLLLRLSLPPGAQGLYDPANEHDACGVGFVAQVAVGLSDHSKASQQAFERAITKAPEVRECHNITGTIEYLLRVEVADLEAYKVFHTDVLGTLPQVTAITSYVVMDSPKDERA